MKLRSLMIELIVMGMSCFSSERSTIVTKPATIISTAEKPSCQNIEECLFSEKDDNLAISIDLNVYSQGKFKLFIPKTVEKVADFYKKHFGVEFRPHYMEDKLKFSSDEKPAYDGPINLVFCSPPEYEKIIQQIYPQESGNLTGGRGIPHVRTAVVKVIDRSRKNLQWHKATGIRPASSREAGIAGTAAHEIAHVAGLWDIGDLPYFGSGPDDKKHEFLAQWEERLLPSRVYFGRIGSGGEIRPENPSNLMEQTGPILFSPLEDYDISNFQVRHLRSSLRGGVAYTILQDAQLHLESFLKKIGEQLYANEKI